MKRTILLVAVLAFFALLLVAGVGQANHQVFTRTVTGRASVDQDVDVSIELPGADADCTVSLRVTSNIKKTLAFLDLDDDRKFTEGTDTLIVESLLKSGATFVKVTGVDCSLQS